MWMMTRHGFYSIVQKDDGIHVRARERQDIENLKAGVGLNIPTLETPSNDYRYRLVVHPEDLYAIMWWLASNVDYSNFKAKVDATPDQRRKPYHGAGGGDARGRPAGGDMKPLLMKGPLVVRSLRGEKTETRRIATPGEPCPYGQPGDRLWVRETWRPAVADIVCGYDFAADGLFVPHADTAEAPELWAQRSAQRGGIESWRPSIFMPRDICRLELELTSVRCERLQDITPDAVRAEGVASLELGDLVTMGASWGKLKREVIEMTGWSAPYPSIRLAKACDGDLTLAWRVLWSAINAHRPGARWEDNPLVWVLGYRRV